MPKSQMFPYTITDHYNNVKEFMSKAKQSVNEKITEPSETDKILRAKIIFEEALETIEKGLGVKISLKKNKDTFKIKQKDLLFEVKYEFNPQELIDGVCDTYVVNTGTLITCGVDCDLFEEVLEIIDENNLTKVVNPKFREDGKIMKPDNYVPPHEDIKNAIAKRI